MNKAQSLSSKHLELSEEFAMETDNYRTERTVVGLPLGAGTGFTETPASIWALNKQEFYPNWLRWKVVQDNQKRACMQEGGVRKQRMFRKQWEVDFRAPSFYGECHTPVLSNCCSGLPATIYQILFSLGSVCSSVRWGGSNSQGGGKSTKRCESCGESLRGGYKAATIRKWGDLKSEG